MLLGHDEVTVGRWVCQSGL